MENKKSQAGDMMMIFAFIFLLLVIGIGIITGLSFFFSSNYEFRKIDAQILNQKISSCIQNQEINWNNQNKDFLAEEIFSKCRLNKKIIEEYFFILIKNGDLELLKTGRGDEVQCSLSEKNINYLKCVNSTIDMEYKNAGFSFFIQTGSNQNSREKITGGNF